MIFISSESDRAYVTSYQWLIVTLALPLNIFEIQPLIAWNFPLKIATKPLQMEKWLLLTAHKKSQAPYPMIPSPTLYVLPFSHNTSVTDKRTTNMPITRPLLNYGRLTRIHNPSPCLDSKTPADCWLSIPWLSIPPQSTLTQYLHGTVPTWSAS